MVIDIHLLLFQKSDLIEIIFELVWWLVNSAIKLQVLCTEQYKLIEFIKSFINRSSGIIL